MEHSKKAREWIVKGFGTSEHVYATADGPVPEINEQVPVIEKRAHDEVLAALANLLDQTGAFDWSGVEQVGATLAVTTDQATAMIASMEQAARLLLGARFVKTD